ncbi:MAG: hypothetical protein B7Z66_15960 [Chromatiales bacterium 21-64-14]|nr:MAG: hypothetical protein B7Z66_15960 [Chromatiales bacterium 21-64-14]
MSILITLFGWLRKVPVWVWLALAAAGVIVVQHMEIGHYKAKAAAFVTETASLKAAQYASLSTIETQKVALKQWADKYKNDMQNGAVFTKQAVQFAADQQHANQSSQQKLRVIYETFPSVKAWAAAHSAPVAVVDRMRDNAQAH